MNKSDTPDLSRSSPLSILLERSSKNVVATPSSRRYHRLVNGFLFGNETDRLAELIQKILGESPAEAKKISRDWLLYRQISQHCWQNMATLSFQKVCLNALDCIFMNENQVARYINNCPRGILITSIHMGDYLNGLLHLCLSASYRREVFILRTRNWEKQEELVFQKFSAAGIRVTVLRRQRSVALIAVKQLKRGNIVVALYDLPRQWGDTTRVTFFEREMSLVKGPAELAILAEADILPIMFHYENDGSQVIDSFPVVRTPSRKGICLYSTVQQLTQYLVTQAELQIRQFPGQWHHWHLLPDMLTSD